MTGFSFPKVTDGAIFEHGEQVKTPEQLDGARQWLATVSTAANHLVNQLIPASPQEPGEGRDYYFTLPKTQQQCTNISS